MSDAVLSALSLDDDEFCYNISFGFNLSKGTKVLVLVMCKGDCCKIFIVVICRK